jgi:hypothetical protein
MKCAKAASNYRPANKQLNPMASGYLTVRVYYLNQGAAHFEASIVLSDVLKVARIWKGAFVPALVLTGVFVRVRRQIRSRWQRFAG